METLSAPGRTRGRFRSVETPETSRSDEAPTGPAGDPRRIVDVRLSAWDILDVSSVRDDQFEGAVALDVPHRLPENTSIATWLHPPSSAVLHEPASPSCCA